MDKQEVANALFDEYAILLLFDFPVGAEFGIDTKSWTTAEKFKGVKMIPPGLHFIYYSDGTNHQAPLQVGFFHDFQPKEMVVKYWDSNLGDVKDDPITEDELDRLQSNRQQLDTFLAPYPYEILKQWVSLTNYITLELLKQVMSPSGKVHSVPILLSEVSNTEQRQQRRQQAGGDESSEKSPEEQLNDMPLDPGCCMNYTVIPKTCFPDDATAIEITKHSMDFSYKFTKLTSDRYVGDNAMFLGELQLSFVCLLIGHQFESFEQWKSLLHLMCGCCEAMSTNQQFFEQFVAVAHFQVREIPDDFFVDEISKNNFLTSCFLDLFENAANSSMSPDMKSKMERFRRYLEDKFKWDFTAETDDCLPVVVDLGE